MNEHETQRIAAAIHQLRPDWPLSSLRTFIANKLSDRPRRDVALALTWVACDSETRTPARVLEQGPWWSAVTTDSTPMRPKWDELCHTCGYSEKGCNYLRQNTEPEDQHDFMPNSVRRALLAEPEDSKRRGEPWGVLCHTCNQTEAGCQSEWMQASEPHAYYPNRDWFKDRAEAYRASSKEADREAI